MSRMSINVYIDGSCINNGSKNARAGYAVFFGENDPRNEYKQVQGKQSNNTGELTAFIRCLQILADEIQGPDAANYVINLYTDSEYVIKCATTYGSKLHAKNWKSKSEIPNLELVQDAYTLYSTAKNVRLHYIQAHTNNEDRHSKGNAEADRLAKLAIGYLPEHTQHHERHIILDWITFDTKDAAKSLGAKWNIKKKHWYVEQDISDETMQELIKLKDKKTEVPYDSKDANKKSYVKIPFAKKDAAKALGARWDASAKSWYYVDGQISDDNKKKLLALQ